VREGIVVSIEDAGATLPTIAGIEATLELKEVTQAIADLPRDQRQVVILAARDGQRYEDMATMLGLPIGTVRSRLSRGRTRLRELIGIGDEGVRSSRKCFSRTALRRAA
jgi:RNA polymerase sigma-70 factor (ECF subfamily)